MRLPRLSDPARPLSPTLALAIALGLAAGFPLPAAAAAAGATKEVSRTIPLAADGTLTIDTYKGSVTLSTWDRSEVSLKARIEPDGDCATSDEDVQRTEVEVSASARDVRIHSDYSRVPSHPFTWGDCGSRPFVHYELKMPRTASLRLKDYKSTSKIDGVAADVEIETYKGTVRATRLAGALKIQTYKGDVDAELLGVKNGVKLETYKGSIDLSLPRNSRFTASGETRKGELEAETFGLTTRALSHHGARLSGDVNGGGPSVSLETYKGTIRLKEL